MTGPTTPQQGLDTLPWKVWKANEDFFTEYLPNWSPNAVHNLQVGVTNPRLAEQLGLPMQNGSHPWINNPLKKIIADIQAGPKEFRTRDLAAVVQFMYEASGAEALASGGSRTGGWIGYSSASDPDLARRAATVGMTPQQYLKANELTLDKIRSSEAGQDVLRLKPRIENGKYTYDFDEATSPKSGLQATSNNHDFRLSLGV